jgi:hypothetical protein
LVLRNKGKINHTYGNVADVAVMPAIIINPKESLDFFNTFRFNKYNADVSMSIVRASDFKKTNS